ncbi:MAG: hypothetical protein ACSLE5_00620 [Porticoccaceae bacterium]
MEQLATSERAQLLLVYLSRHERQLADALANYEVDIAQGMMNTWLQYTPDLEPQVLAETVRAVDLNQVDGIVKAALGVDDYLVDLYQEMVDGAELESLKAVFSGLLKLEESERRQIAKNALRLSDW